MSEMRVTRQALRAKAVDSKDGPKTGPKVEPKMEPKREARPEQKRKVTKTTVNVAESVTPKTVIRKSSIMKSSTPRAQRESSTSLSKELAEAVAGMRKSEEQMKKLNMADIKQLNKDFGIAVNKAKREAEEQELRHSKPKPSKSTRSGLKRGASRVQSDYTEGKYVNIGMDAVRDIFDNDELEYLKKEVRKVKQVRDLKFEHLKYLVSHVFLDELSGIKKGEVQSDYHDRYMELMGESKKELQSEMRLSLFTNEQRAYLCGYLQEQFDATKKDANGDIKHDEIAYVVTVILYETIVRIVKFVHNHNSFEETLEFMRIKSREAYGISEDEEDI